MRHFRPYHFAQYRMAGFRSFYEKIVSAGGVLCFDFEDSIMADAPDVAATTHLKRTQRRHVRHLLRHTPGLDFEQLAVRINAPGTPHYAADLDALRGLPTLHAVFIPKTEDPATIRQVLHDLPLPVRHIIPVVETAAAFSRLPELLAPNDPRLDLVAFGHCDFNLSCGHFPFYHQDAREYWGWLAELDAQLQQAGKQLLNSPVLRLADTAYFEAVLLRLAALPSAVGQITLCLAQTRACAAGVPAPAAPTALAAPVPDQPDLLAEDYEQGRQPNRNFVLDAERRLITPHEYEAARRQLQ